MTTNESFIQAIRDDPDSDAQRLAYAEFLKKQNNPQGQLIEDQCRLLDLSEGSIERSQLELRIASLTDQVHLKLQDALAETIFEPRFEKGFLVKLGINPSSLFASADRLTTLAPFLESVYFGNRYCALREDFAEQLIKCDQILSQLKEIGFCCSNRWGSPEGCADNCLEILLPHLPLLERLQAHRSGITDRGIRAITESETAPQITSLDLENNSLGRAGLAELTQSQKLTSLRHLNLQQNNIQYTDIHLVVESTSFSNLQSLNLRRNNISINSLWDLIDNPNLNALKYLDMRDTRRSWSWEKLPEEIGPDDTPVWITYGDKLMNLANFDSEHENIEPPKREMHSTQLTTLVLPEINDGEVEILLNSNVLNTCRIEILDSTYKREKLTDWGRQSLDAHNSKIDSSE